MLPLPFTYLMLCMTSDIFVHIFVKTAKNTGTLPNARVRKSTINRSFPQILCRFTQKSAEAVRQQEISTPRYQEKFPHFTQWKLRLLLFTYLLQNRFKFFNKICLI